MISIIQLGSVDYATGLRLQQQLVTLRKEDKIGDVVLLLEHKPVITLGRNAKAANVTASPESLRQRGVELFECDRGGDVTFHGPGQIVGYPIFDLRGFARGAGAGSSASEGARKSLGVIEFVRRLEEALIRTCADFGIPTKRITGMTGVWTDPEGPTAPVERTGHVGAGGVTRQVEQSSRALAESDGRRMKNKNAEGHNFIGANKASEETAAALAAEGHNPDAKIAAIGVHISRSVTSHGFALNVNTDLSYFNLIVPCGISAKPVTSMQKELGHELDFNAVAESISRNFGVIFQSQILWVETIDALLGRAVGVPLKPPAELRRIHHEDDSTWA